MIPPQAASPPGSPGTHQRQPWSIFGLVGCPQHVHANTCAPAACPLPPGRPATFGVKGSKQSTATAAIPGLVPPRGSVSCATAHGAPVWHQTPAGTPLVPFPGWQSQPTETVPGTPSVPFPAWQSQPTETLPAMARPCPPWGQAALCSGGFPRQGGCCFPSSVRTIRLISTTTSLCGGRRASGRVWAKQVRLGPLCSQGLAAPTVRRWPLSSGHCHITQ